MFLTTRLAVACMLSSLCAMAQQPDSPEPEPASSTQAVATAPESLITPKQFVGGLLHDQKAIWTFPAKLVKGQHWKPVAAVAIGTAALILLDPHTEPYFNENATFRNYKTGPLRGRNTTLAITMTPVAFYLAGMARHSSYSRNTALLAAQAIIDTQFVSFVTKTSIGRLKPSDIPPHGNYRDTWFKYKGSFTNRGGFPSGHTASAFAVATVIAHRYPKHRWLPYVAYGAATALSLSRLPTQAHFPSDIFIGAAMGYSITRFAVLQR